jgi:hypothetical protein
MKMQAALMVSGSIEMFYPRVGIATDKKARDQVGKTLTVIFSPAPNAGKGTG